MDEIFIFNKKVRIFDDGQSTTDLYEEDDLFKLRKQYNKVKE